MTMLFKNALLFVDGQFRRLSFRVENGVFAALYECTPDEPGVPLGGAPVIPGLVDIHIHGAAGEDFSDGAGLSRMASHLARCGVTSFVPAAMTLPEERLAAAFQAAARFTAAPEEGCARLLGVRMEGPFLSYARRGAQNAAYLHAPDAAMLTRLRGAAQGLLRVVDIAPELPGALPLIREASAWGAVSLAHTDADYETACAALDAGAAHLTHLFNAMPPLHHRAPGAIGAASERESVTAELICDGLHVQPSAVRAAFRLFPGRVCLVSDALRCCGMPEGEYELGGQSVTLRGGAAYLPDGTLAGAASDLFTGLENALAFGIAREEAVLAATLRPAQVVGAQDCAGSIAVGRRADFVICDAALHRRAVYLEGKQLCHNT